MSTALVSGVAALLLAHHPAATPDDVKVLAAPVLGHRLVFKPSAEMRGAGPDVLLRRLVDSEPVPQSGRVTPD